MFIRKDQISKGEYEVIRQQATEQQKHLPQNIVSMLKQLEGLKLGFPVCQYEHALQTATRAEKGGASPELVIGSLCHDVGKAISIANHGAIGASILQPFVSKGTYQVIATHQEFQAKFCSVQFGKGLYLQEKYADENWYDDAVKFSDEWDQLAFDPDYPSKPIEHFIPMIEDLFAGLHQEFEFPKVQLQEVRPKDNVLRLATTRGNEKRERRSSPRQKFENPMMGGMVDAATGDPLPCILQDFSSTGVSITTDRPIGDGTRLVLNLVTEKLNLKVARCSQDGTNLFRVGLIAEEADMDLAQVFVRSWIQAS